MNNDTCPLCGGSFHDEPVIFTADLKPGILVIKDVPARVCNQCGYESLLYETSVRIEEIARSSRNKKIEIEVMRYNAA